MTTLAHVRVSVLMLTCDRPQFIDRAIVSVLAQRFSSWELLVIHDGRNEQIQPQVEKWIRADPRIRYFHRLEKRNIANAYNFGLAHARGEYAAILDDDDYWTVPDKLDRQVQFLDTHPDYAGCGGGMIVIDAQGRELLRYLKREGDPEIKRWALVANPMAHSTMMFRSVVNGQVTRYDESLEGFQDWDLWLSLGRSAKLYNFQQLFTCYTLWPGNGSFKQQRANVHAALTILRRHRKGYRGVIPALGLTGLHYAYAHLPDSAKRRSFTHLSRLKKRLFGRRPDDIEAAAILRIPDVAASDVGSPFEVRMGP